MKLTWILSAAVIAAAGCGGSDAPERLAVRGTVTFDGKPVPAGTITFEPDSALGTKGPAANIPIRNGQFDATETFGAVPGTHRVQVTGFDGEGANEDAPAKMLFPTYATTATVNASTGEIKIDVPKPAPAQRLRRRV